MSVLEILKYPDPRLQTVAKEVGAVDERIRQLAKDMLETMYAAEGVGLAATQVNVHERVLVLDITEEGNAPMVIINPRLLWTSEDKTEGKEGCLSVPTIYDMVERYSQIRISALDENGCEREIEADGILAVCIQHEMDHLAGKVFVDYLSPLKRGRIKTKMRKSQRDAKASA